MKNPRRARRPLVGSIALATALLLGAGCGGGNPYLYGPLGAVVAQPRAKDCAFTLIAKLPEQAHDALGVLAPQDIDAFKAPPDDAVLQKAVGPQVCEAGGDALVVERDAQGRCVRATIIKLR